MRRQLAAPCTDGDDLEKREPAGDSNHAASPDADAPTSCRPYCSPPSASSSRINDSLAESVSTRGRRVGMAGSVLLVCKTDVKPGPPEGGHCVRSAQAQPCTRVDGPYNVK